MNKYTFTQTTRFTNLKPPHEITFEQVQCENMTDEQFDEYGRAYCKEHRIKVDEINKLRHKNCINKEKLIKDLSCAFTKEYIIELINLGQYNNEYVKAENGDFDNE